jgi:general secretion pathway protein D
VVRDAQATDQLSLDRYDLMRAGLQAAQPAPSSLVPINEAPLLPPAPVKSVVGSTPAPLGAPRQ